MPADVHVNAVGGRSRGRLTGRLFAALTAGKMRQPHESGMKRKMSGLTLKSYGQ